MIAPVLQTAVFILSPARDQVLLLHRNKCPDDLHYGKFSSASSSLDKWACCT